MVSRSPGSSHEPSEGTSDAPVRGGDPSRPPPDETASDASHDDATLHLPPSGFPGTLGFGAAPERPLPRFEVRDVGPYRLSRVLGEGGMGTVFLADQLHPIHRQVALKLIRVGIDHSQVVERFEAERRAVARMNHPGIAKIFDAGTTPEGRPYFVMEYVAGEPLSRYCDDHALDTRERVALIASVCDAVQHAHQKGIIHRDLKPSNILVSQEDGRAVSKVIDFGIAKPIDASVTAPVTQAGMILGTLEYMSPEQVHSADEGIDTRSDVYSLGVILYELLTGTLPFDPRSMRGAGSGPVEWLRDREPVRPSTRLGELGDEGTTTARKRKTTAQALTRQLRGDLDWITLKALSRSRRERYATAQELADDLRRYLGHEPVRAGPPRRLVRMRKFVRRHRVSVGFIAAGSALLVAGLVFFWQLSQQLEHERDQSKQYADGVVEQRDLALAESEKLDQVRDFLVEMLSAADPSQDGREVRVLTLLERAAKRLEAEAALAPKVEAALRFAIARTYLGLGLYAEAQEALDSPAIEARLESEPPTDEGSIRSAGVLIDATEMVDLLNLCAEIELRAGRADTALEFYRRAAAWCEAAERHPELDFDGSLWIHARSGESVALKQLDRIAESSEVLDAVIARQKARQVVDLETYALQQNLARQLQRSGDLPAALAAFESALSGFRALAGRDDPNTLLVQRNYGWALHEAERYDAAERELEHAYQLQGGRLGPDHTETLITLNHWAGVVRARGDAARALTLYDDLVARAPKAFGPADWRPFLFRRDRARAQLDLDRFEEAEAELLAVLPEFERIVPATHPLVTSTRRALVDLYQEWGRPDDAARYETPTERNE